MTKKHLFDKIGRISRLNDISADDLAVKAKLVSIKIKPLQEKSMSLDMACDEIRKFIAYQTGILCIIIVYLLKIKTSKIKNLNL